MGNNFYINTKEVNESIVAMDKVKTELICKSKQLDLLSCDILGTGYMQIQNVLDRIKTEIVQETKQIENLCSTLGIIVKMYIQADQINLSLADWASNKGEDVVTEDSTDEMSYEEYLQYREENAIDENTKKVYEMYKDKIKIKDGDYQDTAHYNDFWNHIKYDKDADADNVRGVGCTYFHEVGHLVDDKSDFFGNTSTDGSYDFYDKLSEDLDNYIDDIMETNGYTNREDAYKDLNEWLSMDGNMKNGISDIVCGLTDGEACGAWAHSSDYYNDKSICNEAFAHFFEAGMSDDPTKLEYIKEVFPSAYDEYQRMLEDELS